MDRWKDLTKVWRHSEKCLSVSFSIQIFLVKPIDNAYLPEQYGYADKDIVVMLDNRRVKSILWPTYANIVSR